MGTTVAKILLIDDDADLTEFVRTELEGLGHQVECLGQAEQGPELLRGARPPFRLVLLDLNLPGMSGVEFLRALRAQGISVPVVLVTGDDTSDMAIETTKLGAHDYVVKPVDPIWALAQQRGIPVETPLGETLPGLVTTWLLDPDEVTNYFAEIRPRQRPAQTTER